MCSDSVQPTAKALLERRQRYTFTNRHKVYIHSAHPGKSPPQGSRAASEKPPLSTYEPGVPRSLQYLAAVWCTLVEVAGEHPSPRRLPGCLWSIQAFHMCVQLQSKTGTSGAARTPAQAEKRARQPGSAQAAAEGLPRCTGRVHTHVSRHHNTPIP